MGGKRRREKREKVREEVSNSAARSSSLSSSRLARALSKKKKTKERTFLALGSVLKSPGVLSPRADRYRSVSRKAAGTAPLASANASCV